MNSKKYPIILAHGICPFDKLLFPFRVKDNVKDDNRHYFKGIRSYLISKGHVVFHSRVSWGASLSRRAEDLYKVILSITRNFTRWSRVHIIAHSMGGLDTRMMIYRFRIHDHIASLTTIGTPHWGSSYADWGIKRLGILIWISMIVGLDIRGFRDLTTRACAKFNRRLHDYEMKNKVVYRTVAGKEPYERIFPPLRFPYRVIYREEGPNDGLVSVKSATWKEEYLFDIIDADHLNQIGWWNKAEALSGITRDEFEKRIRNFYLKLVESLP
jgi:triacylglycerol lipase